MRVASHHIGSLLGHNQEVCGLQWSPDGKLLASGGNDNVLNIWPQGGASSEAANPLHTLTHHQAAVKVCNKPGPPHVGTPKKYQNFILWAWPEFI